jgi:hypothetical protein
LLSLRDLQMRFVTALYDGQDATVTAHVEGDPASAAARLAVYRNNLREGFIKALALEYPVVERLVGEPFFRQTALEFQQRHPSRSGDLAHVGEPFPEYLRARFGAGEYAWLPDVAALEWALREVALAPDVPGLATSQLAGVPPHRYPDLVFAPHPATRLVDSAFPVVRIWQTNQPGAPAETVDLDTGGDRVLVRRRGAGLEFVRLDAAAFTFARMLARRTPLGLATDASLAVDPAFELGPTLTRLTLAGAFARVALPD